MRHSDYVDDISDMANTGKDLIYEEPPYEAHLVLLGIGEIENSSSYLQISVFAVARSG